MLAQHRVNIGSMYRVCLDWYMCHYRSLITTHLARPLTASFEAGGTLAKRSNADVISEPVSGGYYHLIQVTIRRIF